MQSIYYGLTIRAGDPRPTPGTARYAEHRRRIHVLVVALYLLYTVYEADYELRRASTFYADLGVPFDAGERDIKSRFRRLAALHHPDKLGSSGRGGGGNGNSNSNSNDGGEFFMHLKTATDVLTDPARRFAYDRFGPQSVAWHPRCLTVRDYVARGAQTALAPHYAVAALALYGLGLLGYLRVGRYWRWLTLAALCVFELHAVTRPAFPWPVERVLNPLLLLLSAGRHPRYLPFQAVGLARRLGITLYIAFNQLGPLLRHGRRRRRRRRQGPGGRGPGYGEYDDDGDGAEEQDEQQQQQEEEEEEEESPDKALQKALDSLEQMARGLDADAGRLVELEMAPFAGDPGLREVMRPKLEGWMVQNTILNDPAVRDAMVRFRQRRRPDAPPAPGAPGDRPARVSDKTWPEASLT